MGGLDYLVRCLSSRPNHLCNTYSKLGSNNLRWCQEDGHYFLKCVKMVVDKMINTPHAHLILVSVIPSPVSNDEDKYLFKKVDLEMKKYANESGGKVTFLNLNTKFITSNQINLEYYNLEERETLHLSEKGASMVAETLKELLIKLNDNKWD